MATKPISEIVTETISLNYENSDGLAQAIAQIDTNEGTGRVRVFLNDGTIYDGNPETDAAPGQVYTLRDLDGTDDADDWLTPGHTLDAQEVDWLRSLRVVAP